MASLFFGAVVSNKETTPYVPRALAAEDGDEALHLSGACIPATCSLKPGTRVSLMLKTVDSKPLCVATLVVAHLDTVPLDLTLDGYSELTLATAKTQERVEVHVNGYYVPLSNEGGEDEEGESDEEEEEEEDGMMPGEAFFQSLLGAPSGTGEEDDEEDDVDDSDDEPEPGHPAGKMARRVTITEITEADMEQDKAESSSGEEAGDAEDSDGAESDEEDQGDDDEEEEDEDEEAAPVQPTVAPTAKGGKRKAEALEAPTDKRVKRSVFANGFEVHQVMETSNPSAPQAKPGKTVTVKYRGTLEHNGKVFDETKGNKTFKFRLGVGEVIKGWDKGVAGMRVGDKRKLIVPPSMGYGDAGVKNVIPKNATLCFDVELCGVK